MKLPAFRLLLFILSLSFQPALGEVSNWPNYLGPNKNSISPDPTPLADSWPEGGPPEVWSLEVQPGHGGPAIVDGKIYLMDRVDGEKDVLRVIDFKTGKVLKESGIQSAGRVNFPGSRSVPTVTEKYVFATGPMGVVAAWKREDLSLLWTIDLNKEYGAEALHFGYPVHPQVYEDLVILSANSVNAGAKAVRFSGRSKNGTHSRKDACIWKWNNGRECAEKY